MDLGLTGRTALVVGATSGLGLAIAVAAFLCSDLACYVTGEQVRCDGGLVAGY